MSAKILVVDDETVLRNNLIRFLSHSGHEVQGAETAEAAIAHLEAHDADVVLTDLKMPGLGARASSTGSQRIAPTPPPW